MTSSDTGGAAAPTPATQFSAFYPPNLPVNNKALETWGEVLTNALSARSEFFRKFTDPRRNLNDECGYPDGWVTAERLNDLYEREALAARVVEIEPDETWQVQPLVYETDDPEHVTEFEKAWDELGQQLRGEDCFFKEEEGSPVWEYLYRLDRLCGIGTYGVLLLGLDDGLPLDQPVQGVYEGGSLPMDAPAGREQEIGKQYPNTSPADLFRQQAAGQGQTTYGPPNSAASPYPKEFAVGGKARPNGQPQGPGGAGGNDDQVPEDSPYGKDDPRLRRKAPTTNAYRHLQSLEAYPQYTLTVNKAETRGRKLLYLRVFPEHLCQITQFESNPASPRFGQPVMYLLTFNDPREQQMGGVGLTTATLNVHWTRVLHVADNLSSSEVFGVPRMRPVLRRLLDLEKLYGGSAEMYWRGAFPGISFETHPQLGGDVSLDAGTLRSEFEKYSNGLQRALYLMGMTAKTLAPTVVDPTSQINVQVEAICIKKGIPVRIFKGSERGELASDQDKGTWASRIRGRQKNWVTPRVIIPFVDRMITFGILPKPNYVPPVDPVTGQPLPPGTDPAGPMANPEGLNPEDASAIDRLLGGTPDELQPDEGATPPPGRPGEATDQPPGRRKAPSLNRRITANAPPPRPGGRPPARPQPGQAPSSPEGDQGEEDGNDQGRDPMVQFDKTRGAGGPAGSNGPKGRQFGKGPSFGKGTPTDPSNPYGPAGAGPIKVKSKMGYCVEWPDPDTQSDLEQAQVALARVQAMSAYTSGGLNALIPETAFMTTIMGFDEEEAKAWTEQAAQAAQEQEMVDMQKQADMVAQGLAPDMSDPETLQAMHHPAAPPNGGPPGFGGPPGGKKPPFAKGGGPPKPSVPGMVGGGTGAGTGRLPRPPKPAFGG